MRSEPLRIGVLISGSGTNLQAIIDAIDEGRLDCQVVAVLSSREGAYGVERAIEAGIPSYVMAKSDYDDPFAADGKIVQIMDEAGAEYLVMAGYMRKLTPVVLEAYPDHVLNLHPALLPAFKGAHAIQDAWDRGVKVTGVTVHFANEDYDMGPIIAQRTVEVREDDTIERLEERIHSVEHELYPEVLQLLAQDKVQLTEEGKVCIR